MKKLLGILVLGLLLSGSASFAEKLLLKCITEKIKTKSGYETDLDILDGYLKLDVSKKTWTVPGYKGEPHKMIVSESEFARYTLDDWASVSSKPFLMYSKINRIDGKHTNIQITISPDEDKKLKKKINATRNDQKKFEIVERLVNEKVLQNFNNFSDAWVLVERQCEASEKKF